MTQKKDVRGLQEDRTGVEPCFSKVALSVETKSKG